MSVRHLGHLFNPASVALIGASERLGSLGAVLARNLLDGDFKGELFLVNRRHRSIWNLLVYRRLAQLPNTPELAIIATPWRTIPRLLLEAGRRGVKVVLIATPSSGRTDEESALLQRALRKATQSYGLRVLGPGSSGIIAPVRNLNLSLVERAPSPGRLAVISQSGLVLAPIMAWAKAQSIGFSRVVGTGEQSDIDIAELLDWLVDDAETQAILLDLDTVRHARPFLSAARAAARLKPVIVLRTGRRLNGIGRQVDAIYDAAFRRTGLLRVQSLRELFGVANLLAHALPVTGDRLAIVGNSGGLGLLAADAVGAEGGRLAQFGGDTEVALRHLLPAGAAVGNPLDLGRDADPERFAAALNILLQERDLNGIVVLHASSLAAAAETTAAAVSEGVEQFRSRTGDSPCVLSCWLGQNGRHPAWQRLQEQRIPTFEMPEDAIRAFMQCWRRVQNRIGLMATPPPVVDFFAPAPAIPPQLVQDLQVQGRDTPDAAATAALLAIYGIVVAASSVTGSTPLELSLRVIVDPLFGPLLLLGTGGRTSHLIQESVVVFPPLNPALAREAIRHTWIYQVLRNADVEWLDGLIALLVKVARLVVDLNELVELELNPIQLFSSGIHITSARLRLAAVDHSTDQRLAIRPYPRELEEILPLPDGSTVLIRPVRPEDEPAFVTSFTQLSTEEVRMRFMYTVKELIHEEAARLTQVDYDREMALVVFRQRPGQPLESCGVARLMRDADGERAEFAIILLRAATGIGLGSLLVRRLINYARRRGFRELFGEILRENAPMLALCRAMGFRIEPCPADAGVMIARWPLV